MMRTANHTFALFFLLLATQSVHCQEAENSSISIGAIKDEAEKAAVRILGKYGDGFGVTDRIVPLSVSGGRGSFNNLSRSFEVDASSEGKFGGLSIRYGIKHYNVGMKTDPDAPPREDGRPVVKFDGDKWMHVFPVYAGIDADKNFGNQDYLFEAGYIPALLRSGDSCFKLGANPIIGLGAQLGQRKRVTESTAEGQNPEASGDLRRIKIEGKMDFPLSCILPSPGARNGQTSEGISDLLFGDLGKWQVIAATANWRDYVENRTYNRHQLTIRVPTGPKSFVDFKREIGAAPTNYDTGAKFSASLTIEF